MEVIKIIASANISEGTSNKTITGTGRLNEEIALRPLYQQVGFTSLPKSGSRHVGIIDGNQITVIAGTDNEDDRPVLSEAGDCAIYASKTIYLKIETGGDITIDNGAATGGKILIKANGDIEIGSASLRALMTDAIISKFNGHTHADPVSGSTGTPNVPSLYTSADATQKVEGE